MAAARAEASLSSPGVLLSEHRNLSLATVMVRKGRSGEFNQLLKQEFGFELPAAGHRSGSPALALAWSAPGQWLASAENPDRVGFETMLRNKFSGVAAISNQSDGRCVIRISGAAARDVLTKGVPIDLHPSIFQPGRTASTIVAHLNVHFWQLDDAPTYEFAVFRSFAAAFWHFLTESAAEFGFAVVD
jgi:sarcosine oxidase subunit gamma